MNGDKAPVSSPTESTPSEAPFANKLLELDVSAIRPYDRNPRNGGNPEYQRAALKGDANDRTPIRPTHRVDAGPSRVGAGIVHQALDLHDLPGSDRGAAASQKESAARP